MDRMTMRALSKTSSLYRPLSTKRPLFSSVRTLSTVPRVAEIAFWKSLIPKPLRRENRQARKAGAPKTSWMAREWNPATFFICIFLLIGSMSIQMISLRNNFDAFMRRADVRIGLLREVVEKIQNGEQVDVEKVLGSGDSEREAIWEEVLNEIEKDSAARNQKRQDKAKASDTSISATKKVSAPQSNADTVPAQVPTKGRTADFY